MSRSVKAAIFDLDGILLDTEPLYTQATSEVVACYGKHYDWSLKKRIMGRSPTVGAQVIVAELELPITAEQYLERREVRLRELFTNAPAIAGAEKLVRELASRQLPLAVATSGERHLTLRKIAKHPWFSLFSQLICGDDPGIVRLKPAPDIFLAAAAALGVEPSQCVVFEDSPAGVAAGLAAGMTVVALPDPHLSAEDVAGAHQVLADYDKLDITALLEGGGSE